MPRLSPSTLLTAFNRHPLLPLVLRSTRSLPSAQNELRWLREHAIALSASGRSSARQGWRTLLRKFCRDRARGRPLQYVMGSQPFGNLDLQCTPGVLIPRPETECYTTYIANLLLTSNKVGGQDVSTQSLRILDLCTGTGCISLLLYSLLSQAFRHISIHGVDISALAINLARKNLRLNVAKNNLPSSALDRVQFFQADVLRPGFVGSSVRKDGDLPVHKAEYDILISNPPYISPEEFTKSTSCSVRNWEPRLALVPCAKNGVLNCKRGDEFYPGLLAAAVQARCQFVALEVADLEQGKRVVSMVQGSGKWKGVEIWRDWVDPRNPTESFVKVDNGGQVTVRGKGNGRVVVCWGGEGEVVSTRQALE